MTRFFMLAIFFALMVKPVSAFERARDLVELLNSSSGSEADEQVVEFALLAFVSGFVQGHDVGRQGSSEPPRFCIPDGVPMGDVADTVRGILEYGPHNDDGLALTRNEFLDTRASIAVWVILSLNYPCADQ